MSSTSGGIHLERGAARWWAAGSTPPACRAHGLDRREPEALLERDVGEQPGPCVQRRQGAIADPTGEHDALARARAPGPIPAVRPPPAATARAARAGRRRRPRTAGAGSCGARASPPTAGTRRRTPRRSSRAAAPASSRSGRMSEPSGITDDRPGGAPASTRSAATASDGTTKCVARRRARPQRGLVPPPAPARDSPRDGAARPRRGWRRPRRIAPDRPWRAGGTASDTECTRSKPAGACTRPRSHSRVSSGPGSRDAIDRWPKAASGSGAARRRPRLAYERHGGTLDGAAAVQGGQAAEQART